MAFFYDFGGTSATRQIKTNKARVAQNLIDLRRYLDERVPPKSVFERLLIATWNVKWLGRYNRLDESLWYIAEILSRFDLIAVQEVNAKLDDFKTIVALLGPWWKFVASDVTEGDSGNEERLVFLYDSRKLAFGGLAGELVLPPVEGQDGAPDTPTRQFARTPLMAGFRCGWFDFVASTVHLDWGPGKREDPVRVAEAEALGEFLARRFDSGKTWSHNLVLLGDFNVFDTQSRVYTALKDHGFLFPHEGMGLPDTGAGQEERFYDHIGYRFAGDAHIAWQKAGVLELFDGIYRDDQIQSYWDVRNIGGRSDPEGYYRVTFRRNEMSDHFPLWTELKIEFPDRYLEAAAAD
jgi:endonuclease/exonuclease/phosphatase family metal-dependent hydrolase